MDRLSPNSINAIGVHPGHTDSERERWRLAEYDNILEFAQKLGEQGRHQIITCKEIWKIAQLINVI